MSHFCLPRLEVVKVLWTVDEPPTPTRREPFFALYLQSQHKSPMALKTLFETGNDLSEGLDCYRRLKDCSFDVYEMSANSNVTIKHRAIRHKPEWSDEHNCYFAGVAYDSFNVWVRKSTGDKIQPSIDSCVAENVSTFEEAYHIAQTVTV